MGMATVSRSDYPTTLRKVPNGSSDASVWADGKPQVRHGDRVTIVQSDANGWTLVSVGNTTQGYIKTQYLRSARS